MFTAIFNFLVWAKLFLPVLHPTCSSSFPLPLTKEEEEECLRKIKEGDEKAKDTLIEHNLRLVVHIIKKYYSSDNRQDDLISIGTIGLIKAADSFDYEKGAKFATYAARCIENEILMYFRRLKKLKNEISLSTPVDRDKDGNELTLMDIMADKHSLSDEIDTCMKKEQLQKAVNKYLSQREKEIIMLRYGIGGNGDLTQKEVAKRLSISRSYVSRIEKRALQKLKEHIGPI